MDNLIYAVQEEIKNTKPNYKYTDYYRLVELEYWGCIPEWIKQLHSKTPIKSCLDIGVAMGTLLLYTHKISDCDLYACEIEQHLSYDLIDKYQIDYSVTNIELQKLNTSKKKFDCIIFTEVMEHLKYNPVYTMKKIANMLSTKGSLFLSTPNVAVWGKLDNYESYKMMPIPEEYKELQDLGHEYHYSFEEMLEIFDEVGLKVNNFDYSPEMSMKHFNFELKRK